MEHKHSLDKTISEPNLSTAVDDLNEPRFDYNVTSRSKRKRSNEELGQTDFSDFRQEIKDLFQIWSNKQDVQLQKQDAQFQKLFPILNGIQEANTSIETTLNFLAEQNTEVKRKVELLEIEVKKKDEHLAILEERLEDSLRMSRKSTIEIKNIPLDSKETKDGLISLVQNLAKTIDLPLNGADVKDIYKTKGSSEKKTVIVELNSTLIKEDFLKKAKLFNKRNHSNKLCAKHLGIKRNPDNPIFLSECLTPKAARLFFLARDLRKSKGYKYCWTSFGRVYVRRDDTSAIIHITNESTINALMKD
ncbi:hypothetical protein ABMA27_003272 [Loxostege sticticalis]|uniref:FP protein C-terminal domain-containing protein n=1 Tax=Loxostege sticticalis TaxID=481309 RepID=A0ABR3HSJ8_LOXSC